MNTLAITMMLQLKFTYINDLFCFAFDETTKYKSLQYFKLYSMPVRAVDKGVLAN